MTVYLRFISRGPINCTLFIEVQKTYKCNTSSKVRQFKDHLKQGESIQLIIKGFSFCKDEFCYVRHRNNSLNEAHTVYPCLTLSKVLWFQRRVNLSSLVLVLYYIRGCICFKDLYSSCAVEFSLSIGHTLCLLSRWFV